MLDAVARTNSNNEALVVHPDVELTPFEATSFPAEPGLECDIVMKGGITSGVVYPLAVCELAKVYRLRSVGGASAGAIAAAAAAAAEVGRAEGADAARGGGFLGLSRFPDELMEKQQDGTSLLFHLFRPQPAARRIFALLMAGLDGAAALPKPVTPRSAVPLVRRLLRSGARAFPMRALVGALPGLALMILAVLTSSAPACWAYWPRSSSWSSGWCSRLVGLAVGVVTGVLADLGGLSEHRLRDLLRPGRDRGGDGTDAVAARPAATARGTVPTGDPLTFADLAEHKIDLRVMTTNLSRNQPLAMPWDNNTYFFDPARFPDAVPRRGGATRWCSSRQPLPHRTSAAQRQAEVLRRARQTATAVSRAPTELPILVRHPDEPELPFADLGGPAVRRRLRPARTTRTTGTRSGQWRRQNPGRRRPSERSRGRWPRPNFDVNWFSDGGLAANLPVHFFDSPLPTRPTFAIDLAPFAPRPEAQRPTSGRTSTSRR